MVPLFIRYHKLTSFRRITLPSGGARRAEDRHPVFNKSHPLQSERNFEAELIRRRPAAEKDLCASPLACFGGDIEWGHFIAAAATVPIGPRIEKGAQVIFLAQTGGEHEHSEILVLFNITAEGFCLEQRQKIFVAARRQNCIGIGSAREQRAKE